MLQALCRVEPLFEVPPAAFRPPPKVDSAVVRLLPRAPGEVGIADPALFERVVREAFGQRRKTLRNALSLVCDADAIVAAGLRPELRAEQIEVAGFINLSNRLAQDLRGG
jgi:16S rRNA (adenine1518-N6/adenine1519-N6)-dimethyltransferase